MEYGKFASADELLKAYNELEKNFTQKCQQLSELRKSTTDGLQKNAVNQSDENSGTNETSSPLNATPTDENAAQQQPTDCAVPADVQPSAANSNSPNSTPVVLPKLMAGGGNVSPVLPTKPKTIKEASVLARKLFEN